MRGDRKAEAVTWKALLRHLLHPEGVSVEALCERLRISQAEVATQLAEQLDHLGYEAIATTRGGEPQVEAFNCVFHTSRSATRTYAVSTWP